MEFFSCLLMHVVCLKENYGVGNYWLCFMYVIFFIFFWIYGGKFDITCALKNGNKKINVIL